MSFLSREDEFRGYEISSWHFWRNLAVYFCIWSVLGHFLEIAYCSFMNLFGIVDEGSLVWGDPFYPFLVYGVSATLCVLLLVPVKEALLKNRKTVWAAVLNFFVISIIFCMLLELAMGFMLNQPNGAGEYPLWDNSKLPLNIFDQAWLVNDIFLGLLALLYTWVIYPFSEKVLSKINPVLLNVISVVIVASFILLCVFKFS